jgi:DNA-binding FadR family transcriptional regulator
LADRRGTRAAGGGGTFLTEAAVRSSSGTPADTSPAEIMQARMVMEPQVMALAARQATQTDIDRRSTSLASFEIITSA